MLMFFMRFSFISIISLFAFTSCTLSFNNISTEGQASDVVDEDQQADAKVDPVLTIPASLL